MRRRRRESLESNGRTGCPGYGAQLSAPTISRRPGAWPSRTDDGQPGHAARGSGRGARHGGGLRARNGRWHARPPPAGRLHGSHGRLREPRLPRRLGRRVRPHGPGRHVGTGDGHGRPGRRAIGLRVARAGRERAVTIRAGSGRFRPIMAGSGRLWPVRAGSGRFGPGRAGAFSRSWSARLPEVSTST